MKKLTALILAIILIFSTTVCFAQKVEYSKLGTTFHISDDWKESKIDGTYAFEHKENSGEYFYIYVDEAEDDITLESTEELNATYSEIYSDEQLSSVLSRGNGGVDVSVTTDSVEIKYEIYNNVKYYRYEKAYTAVADGFNNGRFYITALLTIQNGIMYEIIYEHNYQSGHFSDIVDMLNGANYGKIIDIYVNEKEVVPDTYPEIFNDRTIVPIRAIVEELGYTVDWDAETRTVKIENEKTMLELTIANLSMNKTDKSTQKVEKISLDVPALIANDRTYLPLRAVGEALNCDVNWDGATRTININSK